MLEMLLSRAFFSTESMFSARGLKLIWQCESINMRIQVGYINPGRQYDGVLGLWIQAFFARLQSFL